MKGTFAPTTLNDPETIYTNASTKKALYVFYLDGSNMVSGDTVKVIIQTDVTTNSLALLTDYITVDTLNEDGVAMSFPVLIEANDTYEIVLEQTTGSVKNFDWAVSVVEY